MIVVLHLISFKFIWRAVRGPTLQRERSLNRRKIFNGPKMVSISLQNTVRCSFFPGSNQNDRL